MTLFEFKEEYLKAFNEIKVDPETGEYIGFEALEDIKGEFEEKAEAVALFIKQLDAEEKAIKEEASALTERAKSKANKADRLKEYLAYNMNAIGTKKLETVKVALSFRKSESVRITDEFAIPQDYLRRKITEEPDKTKIKKAIKDGLEVAGCVLETKESLQIK